MPWTGAKKGKEKKEKITRSSRSFELVFASVVWVKC